MRVYLSKRDRIYIVLECVKGKTYASVANSINARNNHLFQINVRQVKYIYQKFLKDGTILNEKESRDYGSRTRQRTIDPQVVINQVQADPHISIRRINYATGT